ncbi:MarR family winged helix-turn-helix transcriptional regulator [Microbispora sp. ATCC PTA-5024]|uniref:MarR family winged helix-turn-helix transcriptional regulator n=1 Tax=Microbispora sp. ATCC PTA-5024 TaxID=316330 RepID=UPI0003DC5119|nr:MarR family transcriptional regulator [Microbispora sp. ATCC PTA-5024]ETK31398.1 MarR family transcriptional regulator [Microbispora sp. ATCC PTA-5024]
MSTPRWLDEDEQRAWRAYMRMQGRLTAHLNHRLQADSGLSLADYEVLVLLTDVPDGRLRPFEIQRGLDWEQSRLSHHLSRMQRRGLIAREECAEDGRGALVVLTDEGRRAIGAAAPAHVETVRRVVFDGLSEEEVTALERLSSRVLDRIEATGTPAPPAAGHTSRDHGRDG